MAAQAKGHSAKVGITLIQGGRRIPVAQVGNSGLLVRELDAPVPAGEAVLLVKIDQQQKRHRILLPEGITEANRFVKFF
ncbi:hypothetical protein [Aeoliella mucimassa]|uniref:hypothetical protein n=1 Tax=Aeoliella mucimassa TaxID=2527972 RepID=UPI0011A619AF|nr:hypothetical protein [Aeoliella mucimassa]